MLAASLAPQWSSPECHELIGEKIATNHEKVGKYLPPNYPNCSHAFMGLSGNVLSLPRHELNPAQVKITEEYDATGLLAQIASKELSSEEVVRAFCTRAAVAHRDVNCLTEVMFDEAVERAKELDEYLEREGKTMGPLHGLPVSVKVSSLNSCILGLWNGDCLLSPIGQQCKVGS